MTIERLLVGALATWRITSLLLREDGPFYAFTSYRTAISRIAALSPLATCVWCLSIWVGIGVTLVALTDAWLILIPFALSAATIGLEKLT